MADGPLSRKSVAMQESSTDSAVAREPEIERVILLRGVVWQGKEVNAFKMWQDLMRFWPTPFAPEHTKSPNQLYAHAGTSCLVHHMPPLAIMAIDFILLLQRPPLVHSDLIILLSGALLCTSSGVLR